MRAAIGLWLRTAAVAGASATFLIAFGLAHGIPMRVMLRVLRGGDG